MKTHREPPFGAARDQQEEPDMSRTLTAIEKGTNAAGKVYALVRDSDGTFSVWTIAENYAGHVHGGIARSWRYCAMGMTESDARAMYAKKLKRKPRPSLRFVAMQDFGDGRGFIGTFFFKARSQAEADRKLSAKLSKTERRYYAQQVDEAAH